MRNIRNVGGKKLLSPWRLIPSNSAFLKMTLIFSWRALERSPRRGAGGWAPECSSCWRRLRTGSGNFLHSCVLSLPLITLTTVIWINMIWGVWCDHNCNFQIKSQGHFEGWSGQRDNVRNRVWCRICGISHIKLSLEGILGTGTSKNIQELGWQVISNQA